MKKGLSIHGRPFSIDGKMKLYYIYDALCGWCYGFSPVMSRFFEEYKDELSFEVISGGMVTGDRVGPIGEVAPYIKEAYRDVEERTGVTFGEDFLKDVLADGHTIFDSLPPALALRAFKFAQPDQVIPFASRIQKAIYFDGMAPRDEAGYGRLAEEFGLSAPIFRKQMNDPTTLATVRAEFELVQNWGINGFPTILLEYGKEEPQLGVLARGYLPFEQLEAQYLRAKEILPTLP